jgi:hypothetical protein
MLYRWLGAYAVPCYANVALRCYAMPCYVMMRLYCMGPVLCLCLLSYAMLPLCCAMLCVQCCGLRAIIYVVVAWVHLRLWVSALRCVQAVKLCPRL